MNLFRVCARWLGPAKRSSAGWARDGGGKANSRVRDRGAARFSNRLRIAELSDPEHRLGDEFELGYREVLRSGPLTMRPAVCRSAIRDKDKTSRRNRPPGPEERIPSACKHRSSPASSPSRRRPIGLHRWLADRLPNWHSVPMGPSKLAPRLWSLPPPSVGKKFSIDLPWVTRSIADSPQMKH